MQLERLTPTKYQMTLHTYELATMVSALRWITDGARGELPDEVKVQMKSILQQYDKATSRLLKK